MWRGIISVGLVMALVTLFTIDLFLPGGLVEGTDTLEVARTAGFTTLVLAQLFNALNARSETTSAFHGLFTEQVAVGRDPARCGAAGRRGGGAVPAGRLRHRVDGPRHWGACVVLASAVLWYDESAKCSSEDGRTGRPTLGRLSRSLCEKPVGVAGRARSGRGR